MRINDIYEALPAFTKKSFEIGKVWKYHEITTKKRKGAKKKEALS